MTANKVVFATGLDYPERSASVNCSQRVRVNKLSLRREIIRALETQGFSTNPHLKTEGQQKDALRKVHQQKRNEVISAHKHFLLTNLAKARKYAVSGNSIDPAEITLELMEVKPESPESALFFWWNLVWWSLPYDKPMGRQMRFMLWDRQHDAPFGLLGLQSPPLRSGARDRFLGLDKENVDYWINQSMYAQRVGALPPYNDLLGAKMVALSMTCNEIRERYHEKYKEAITLMRQRRIPGNLLFITTTSAYGKSSIYERIKYQGDIVNQFIGFTAGSGTFHIPQRLYEKMLSFLEHEGYDTRRGYGTGPSRKLRLIEKAFRKLGLSSFAFHNIKRGHYIFPNVRNLRQTIHENEMPDWQDRPFSALCDFWKRRWCLPRSIRSGSWRLFDADKYFDEVSECLSRM